MKPDPNRLGDAPIDPALHELMNDLAALLDDILNPGLRGEARTTGFILLAFPFGSHEGRRANYISNADRADVVTMLKHQLARFEGQPDVKGRA